MESGREWLCKRTARARGAGQSLKGKSASERPVFCTSGPPSGHLSHHRHKHYSYLPRPLSPFHVFMFLRLVRRVVLREAQLRCWPIPRHSPSFTPQYLIFPPARCRYPFCSTASTRSDDSPIARQQIENYKLTCMCHYIPMALSHTMSVEAVGTDSRSSQFAVRHP